jgi:hypothetical protein
LREIDVIKQEAFMLKEQMRNVREDLLKVEKNTVNDSMKLLLDLDIIRSNLLGVQLALQVSKSWHFIKIINDSNSIYFKEADNWSSLTQDLDSILQSKDMNAVISILSIVNSIELLNFYISFQISNHIESMQNIEKVLLQDDSVDYVNRCTLLEEFKNKFETIMSADIISTFNSKSIGKMTFFFS